MEGYLRTCNKSAGMIHPNTWFDGTKVFAITIGEVTPSWHRVTIECATEGVKQVWKSMAIAKWFGSSRWNSYLCTKTMNRKAIEEVMKSEGLLERFVETLLDEINIDDETYNKKGRQLLELCLTDEHADDF